MTISTSPIGVFDSGIGGLSILKALLSSLPSERFVYFADTKYNPYGEKPEGFVVERSLAIVKNLVQLHQIKALVVACNTATAAAIVALRQSFPDLPIVGVEPALKPAALATKTGQVLVLATRGTLQSEKFGQLKARLEAQYAGQVGTSLGNLQYICLPCEGLAERIEQLSIDGSSWENAPDLIANYVYSMSGNCVFGSYKNREEGKIDTLVLGCTHYPLIRDLFRAAVGDGVMIMDNAQPVALRTLQLLGNNRAPSDQIGSVIWLSSGDQAQLLQAARYWGVESA